MAKHSANGTALTLILGFTILSIIFYQYSDSISEYVKNADIVTGTIIYIITCPIYLAVIVYFVNRYQFPGFLASLLIITAADIQSLPHIVPMNGVMIQDGPAFLFMDSIIYKTYPWIGVFHLYVTLPVLLLVLAYFMVSPSTFNRLVRNNI